MAPAAKNAGERARALTLALSHDDEYLAALGNLRHCEHEQERIEALLEAAHDDRRADEWRTRAQLCDVLERRGIASSSPDRVGGAFDDTLDRQVDDLVTRYVESKAVRVVYEADDDCPF